MHYQGSTHGRAVCVVENVRHLVIVVAGYCCTLGVLSCMCGAGVRTFSATRVHRFCYLDISRIQTKLAHLLRDVKESVRSPYAWLWLTPLSLVSAVSALPSLPRPCLSMADMLGGGVVAVGGVEVTAMMV